MNFFQNFKKLVENLTDIFSGGVVNLLMALVFVFFLFSIINFLWRRSKGASSYGGDNSLQDAKNMLGWSIIAMFVMVSVWGIVNFLQEGFGIKGQTKIEKPQTNFRSYSEDEGEEVIE